jgi:hypothetical protein
MGRFAVFGFAFVIAYWVSYLMLWARVSCLRDMRLKPGTLPSTSSLFLGTAALAYLWSDQHRQAKDPKLSQLVLATRITQLLIPVGVVIALNL